MPEAREQIVATKNTSSRNLSNNVRILPSDVFLGQSRSTLVGCSKNVVLKKTPWYLLHVVISVPFSGPHDCIEQVTEVVPLISFEVGNRAIFAYCLLHLAARILLIPRHHCESSTSLPTLCCTWRVPSHTRMSEQVKQKTVSGGHTTEGVASTIRKI